MTRSRDLASLGDNTSKLEQQGLVQIIASSVTKGASGSASVDSKGNVTFSGTESISLNDIFSSSYDNYRLMISHVGTNTNQETNFRFRVSGSDSSANNYQMRMGRYDTSWITFASGLGTLGYLGRSQTNRVSMTVDIFNPFQTLRTNLISHNICATDYITGGCEFTDTTSFTGFTVYPSAGTFTGTIRIYGYNQ